MKLPRELFDNAEVRTTPMILNAIFVYCSKEQLASVLKILERICFSFGVHENEAYCFIIGFLRREYYE